ncbi:MAG: DUF4251 domain-containing protein [Bacteroidales bacterium]|nr:DUF4251 domain-containing protein [Bacteroidales bacterium]
MKRILFVLLALFIGFTSAYAQQDEKKAAKEEAKAQKQKEKEAKKALEAAQQLADFNAAVVALNNGSFVLEADKVEFKRGTFINVIPTTNFVMQEGEDATVQLSFNGAAIGPNGVGGLTVDGHVSKPELTTDKKGNIHYSFMINGVGISASITITLPNGTNYCTATVTPNFNSTRTSFSGYLKPKNRAKVHKGMAF